MKSEESPSASWMTPLLLMGTVVLSFGAAALIYLIAEEGLRNFQMGSAAAMSYVLTVALVLLLAEGDARDALLDLAAAPVFVTWKLMAMLGPRTAGWVRTQRHP